MSTPTLKSPPSSSTEQGSKRPNESASSRQLEVNLNRAWKQVIHSAIIVTNKAEKAAADPQNRSAQKELHDKTKEFLAIRNDFGKTLTNVSDRLEGKAAEVMERARYVRTHPSLAPPSRKRQRKEVEVITLD